MLAAATAATAALPHQLHPSSRRLLVCSQVLQAAMPLQQACQWRLPLPHQPHSRRQYSPAQWAQQAEAALPAPAPLLHSLLWAAGAVRRQRCCCGCSSCAPGRMAAAALSPLRRRLQRQGQLGKQRLAAAAVMAAAPLLLLLLLLLARLQKIT